MPTKEPLMHKAFSMILLEKINVKHKRPCSNSVPNSEYFKAATFDINKLDYKEPTWFKDQQLGQSYLKSIIFLWQHIHIPGNINIWYSKTCLQCPLVYSDSQSLVTYLESPQSIFLLFEPVQSDHLPNMSRDHANEFPIIICTCLEACTHISWIALLKRNQSSW